MSKYIKAVRLWGLRRTLQKMYMLKDVKFGALQGVDKFGNEYFENAKDYHWGQHRWVEHKKWDSNLLAEASVVPPEWHRWLHGMTDDPPGTGQMSAEGARTGLPIFDANVADGVPAGHHNAEHQTEWHMNYTIARERGHETGSYYSAPGENKFYSQPGARSNPHQSETESKVESWVPGSAKGSKRPIPRDIQKL